MGIRLRDVLKESRFILNNANIEDSEFESFEIVKFYCGVSREFIYGSPLAEVGEDMYKYCMEASKKRAEHYPLQYIFGEWEFFGRTFKVGEGVLVPRPDTEVICEKAIDYLKDKPNAKIVDLFSGSGNIAITLDLESKIAEVSAIEKSDEAFKYLEYNINALKSKTLAIKGDVLAKETAEKFANLDLITANPPYLTQKDMENLQKEASFEPKEALFGGNDGLYFYEKFIPLWKNCLNQGGAVLCEIGYEQGSTVEEIFKENGFENIEIIKDYSQNDRGIFGIKR